VAVQFSGNQQFQRALKDSFESVLNKDLGKSSKYSNCEILAHYADRVLRGTDRLDEEGVGRESERIVALYGFLSEKDVFGEIYKNLLSKRLLSGKVVSDASERSFIHKLKLAQGALFTQKMEGMMNDLSSCTEQSNQFLNWCSSRPQMEAGFTVQVLANGWWPITPFEISPPPLFRRLTQTFETWYSEVAKRTNRRLIWSYSHGTLSLKANYASKSYTFDLNPLQAIILLFFNDASEPLTYAQIANEVGCKNVEACKRILHSLACAKFKILTKSPPGSTIGSNDTFTYNPDFSNPATKNLKVPMPSLEESHNKVKMELDRKNMIDACLVRIMKARKTLSFEDLIAQTLHQVSSISILLFTFSRAGRVATSP